MFKPLIFIILLLMMSNSHGLTISWVGDSSTCDNTANTHNTLIAALFAALLNNDDDEIRLTAQASYLGNAGSYVLTDWNPSTTGSIKLKGGYFDCGSSQSGRTIIGDTSGSIFNISTSSQPISSVSFENIEIRNGDIGLEISGGAEVTLLNTVIKNHQQGVRVSGGAFLDVSSDSLIENNDDYDDFNSEGGGIYCSGANSLVTLKGTLSKNRAFKGGNLFVTDQCFVELEGGAELIGANNINIPDALSGGGIMVENFGQLIATGGQQLVIIRDHASTTFGGGILVDDNGLAILLNTHLINNTTGRFGAAIYVRTNGQLNMDRVDNCPFLISCSKITQHDFINDVVSNRGGTVEISRTIIDQNIISPDGTFPPGIISNSDNSAITRLDRVGIVNNETNTALSAELGTIEVAHATIARNNSGAFPARSMIVDAGSVEIENSILTDSSGAQIIQPAGSISGKCNLVNLPGEMPSNTYFIGTAVFNDSAGDLRQRADSDGVDACFEDSFAWSNNVDIEFQNLPANESTNPNGFPGETGGLYDAGFDEALINVGPDDVIFINGFD